MAQNHDTKEWLRAVAAYMNLSLSDLALKSGLAASTVTRYINDRSGTLSITDRSLDKISTFTGIAKNVMPGQRRLPGFGESEAVPYNARGEDRLPAWVEAAIAAHKQGRHGVEPWVMKSWALDLLGVYPGDVLMIDQIAGRVQLHLRADHRSGDRQHGDGDAALRPALCRDTFRQAGTDKARTGR